MIESGTGNAEEGREDCVEDVREWGAKRGCGICGASARPNEDWRRRSDWSMFPVTKRGPRWRGVLFFFWLMIAEEKIKSGAGRAGKVGGGGGGGGGVLWMDWGGRE